MRDGEHWILPRLAAGNGWAKHPSHWLLDGQKMEAVFGLLKEAFAWARAVGPSQPLTTAVWDFPRVGDDKEVALYKLELNRQLLQLSDVVSLHCYCDAEELEERLLELESWDRGPVLVTEFMARPRNSTLANNLPVLRQHGAWGYTWGLFRGKSQTHRPWDSWVREDIAEDAEWFHDVFYENGSAYDPSEARDIWWHTTGQNLKL
ncbi:unnamed protein product [Polarella glacialis]|uniref:Uncharacterized protein n=1 Tax=Polarella glacialis TaxID=89957 RepID=A0A813HWZ5_POLGL|nr:unnamed protein product [Polarella glacialis]